MDKYDKHLQFLIEALPTIKEDACSHVFLEEAKRDIRKALFFLLQPQAEEAVLIADLALSKDANSQMELLDKILHHYCPNKSYTKIVNQLSKGKPFKIDTATLPKLKTFRRAPRKERLNQYFALLRTADEEVLAYWLNGLKPFGRELEPLWATVDAYANYPDVRVAKAALNLLAEMPSGVQKSIMTFSKHLADPDLRFYALSSMHGTTGLSKSILLHLFDPIIAEYKRLSIRQGAMNDLWEEFKLVRSILKNNGVLLSITDISLGRF